KPSLIQTPVATLHKDTSVFLLLDSKLKYGKLYYFLDWEGYTPADRSWEPADNLNCHDLITDFHLSHPSKPHLSLKIRHVDFAFSASSS
ncbi:hypothetical protein BB558_001637, partial [Smittium angustum]